MQRIRKCNIETAQVKCPERTKIHLQETIHLKPHQTKVIQAEVKEQPGTNLLVYPYPRYSTPSCPFLVEVDIHQKIPVI